MTFQHSRVLFTLEDGRPLRFQMPPCAEKGGLKAVIEHGGGILSSKYEKNTIRLAVPGKKIHEDGALDTKFINDCVQKNKLLNINKYKLHSGEVMKVSDDDMEPATSVIRVDAKDKSGRKKYMLDEDLEIIRWVIDEGHYDDTGGNAVWKQLEREKIIPGHSWQSVKDRYRKHILPNIHSYTLEDHHVAKIRGTINDKYSSKRSDKGKGNKYISMLQFCSSSERKSRKRTNSTATNSSVNDSANTSRHSSKVANSVNKSANNTSNKAANDSANTEEVVIDDVSPVASVSNKAKTQQSSTPNTSNTRKVISPCSFYSPKSQNNSTKNSETVSDVSETLDEFDKQLLNCANPNSNSHNSSRIVNNNRNVSSEKHNVGAEEKAKYDFDLWKDNGKANEDRIYKKRNHKMKSHTRNQNISPHTDARIVLKDVNKVTDITEVTSSSDVMHNSAVVVPHKKRKVKSSIASDEPSSSQVDHQNTLKTDDSVKSNNKYKFKSTKQTMKEDDIDENGKHTSKYFERQSSPVNSQCSKTDNTKNNVLTGRKFKKNRSNVRNTRKSSQESDNESDLPESQSLLSKNQNNHGRKRLLRSQSNGSSANNSDVQVRTKKKPRVLDTDNTSQDSSEDERETLPVIRHTRSKDARKSSKAVQQSSCRKNIMAELSEDSEEIDCVPTNKQMKQSSKVKKLTRTKEHSGSKKPNISPQGLRSFLMAERQSTHSSHSEQSVSDHSDQVDTQEFDRALISIHHIGDVFSLTPAQVLLVCHWVGGELDEAVHYILYGTTKAGYPAWMHADDMMLQDCNCNEAQYRALEAKFSEMGVLQRQQYLDENML